MEIAIFGRSACPVCSGCLASSVLSVATPTPPRLAKLKLLG